jgi:hypothetical protein
VVPVVDPVSLLPKLFDGISAGGSRTCGQRGNDIYCWGIGNVGTLPLDGGAMPDPTYPQLVQFPP